MQLETSLILVMKFRKLRLKSICDKSTPAVRKDRPASSSRPQVYDRMVCIAGGGGIRTAFGAISPWSCPLRTVKREKYETFYHRLALLQ